MFQQGLEELRSKDSRHAVVGQRRTFDSLVLPYRVFLAAAYDTGIYGPINRTLDWQADSGSSTASQPSRIIVVQLMTLCVVAVGPL